MVSTFERQILFGGIISLYAYTGYMFVQSKYTFNKKFHESLINQATKFEKEINLPNFKFVNTPNDKVLFLIGVENNKNAFKSENVTLIEKVIENFTPNFFVYERDLKHSSRNLANKKEEIVKLFEESFIKKHSNKSNNPILKSKESDDVVNIQTILTKLAKLNERDRLSFFMELDRKVGNISFDFFNLYSDYRRNSLSGNKCSSLMVGLDFLRIKSMIRKRLNLSDTEQKDSSNKNNVNDYVALKDISKMTMKQRIQYKEHQLEINGKYNLYEDIKNYIKTEINNEVNIQKLKTGEQTNNRSISSKNEAQVDQIFSQVVIDEMNDVMINNILDNKRIYIAVVIVRNERLTNLFEKLSEYNKNI